jgi:hypothetical protein
LVLCDATLLLADPLMWWWYLLNCTTVSMLMQHVDVLVIEIHHEVIGDWVAHTQLLLLSVVVVGFVTTPICVVVVVLAMTMTTRLVWNLSDS